MGIPIHGKSLYWNHRPLDHQKSFNTLRPKQNGCHFADDIFKCILLNENGLILFKISLKFVPINISTLDKIMAWCRPGDKPLSELMMSSHNENFWAFAGRAWIWLDFPDSRHDCIKEVYQSDMCFASRGLRTDYFRGDWMSSLLMYICITRPQWVNDLMINWLSQRVCIKQNTESLINYTQHVRHFVNTSHFIKCYCFLLSS